VNWWHDIWMQYHSNKIEQHNRRFKISNAYKDFKKIDAHEKKFRKHSSKVYK
jgi:hypothetical protein